MTLTPSVYREVKGIHSRWRAGGLLIACAGLAMSCSKHPDPPPAAPGPAASPQGASQPTSPSTSAPTLNTVAERPSAKALADILTNREHSQAYKAIAQAYGFTMDSELECSVDPTDFHADFMCYAGILDGQRGGRGAELRFYVFDTDVNVPVTAASFRHNKESTVPGQAILSTDADIASGAADPSAASRSADVTPGRCYQSLGAKNDAAFCVFFPNSRIIVTTSVNPAKVSFEPGDDQNGDSQHSKDLGLVALLMLKASGVVSTINASAASTNNADRTLQEHRSLVMDIMKRSGGQNNICDSDPSCAALKQHIGKN